MKSKLFISALSAGTALSLSMAHAQTAETKPEARPTSSADIIVTAAKREQSLEDVSIAVNAVSGDRLAEAQVSTMESLQTLIPTVTIGQDNGIAKISMRGVGLNTSVNLAESGIAVHADGAVISRPEAQLASFFDLERVEVLRGPQGTLYGRNAVGGAVNLITAKPTKELSGYLSATVGKYNQFDLDGAISGSLTDTLSARLSYRSEDHSGYGKSVLTGRDVDDSNRQMGRLQLLWEPTDNFSWRLIGEKFRQDDASGAPHLGALAYPSTVFIPTGIGGYATDKRDYGGDADPFKRMSTWSATNIMEYQVNDWLKIVNLSNYRDFQGLHSYDYDMSTIVNRPELTGRPLGTHQKFNDSIQYSNEFQIHTDTEFVDGVLAAFYFKEKAASRVWYRLVGSSLIGNATDRASYLLNGTPLETIMANCGLGGIAYDPKRADGQANTPPNYCSNANHETEVWSIFGQYNIHLDKLIPGLSLKLGGRYNHEERHVYNAGSTVNASGGPATVVIPSVSGVGIGSRSFSRFTPEAGVEWKANDDVLLYYTYSEGFKSGVGEGNAMGSSKIINPEYIKNHELGAKFQFMEDRLTLNLAAFRYELSGLQTQRSIVNPATGVPVQVFENAAGVEAKGAEADVYFNPVPQFRLNFSAAYLDSTYTDYLTTDNINPIVVTSPTTFNSALSPFIQLAGNPTRNSPKWTLGGGAEYDFLNTGLPGNGVLTPRIDIFYRDTTYYSDFKRLAEGMKAYTLIDASLRYDLPDSGLTASLWVKNVTDELVISNTYASLTNGVIGNSYAPPRTFGFTVRRNF